ncbi:MAG: glycosyltransferase family 4 protein [Cyclobacteriaceae bacterium]|nr:glycosyltransferase family 4 protein [Cyclobacteriaceae bacterium]
MKILLLHQHFKTPAMGGVVRSYYLAKALVDRGHRVMVITAWNGKQSRTEQIDGIEVHYLPVAYDNSFGFYKRSWSFVRFNTGAIRLASKFRDFTVCYAISVPLTIGLAARWISMRFGMPYVFEVGDLWPDAPIQMGFVKNYFFKQMLLALEKSIYRHARFIVALSPAIQAAIEKKVPEKTVYMVPNMSDTDFYKPVAKDPILENKFRVTGKWVVSYIGAVGVANGLDYFLECANASRKAGLPIQFILCGTGAVLGTLKQLAASMGLQNISFVDFVDRDGTREVMNVTDAVFVSYKNVPILETGSPNKFFDGLAAGKLIVINFSGWVRKEVEQARCGIFVDPLQPLDFVKKISPFLQDTSQLKSFQGNARQLAERKFNRTIITETFAGLFSKL